MSYTIQYNFVKKDTLDSPVQPVGSGIYGWLLRIKHVTKTSFHVTDPNKIILW